MASRPDLLTHTNGYSERSEEYLHCSNIILILIINLLLTIPLSVVRSLRSLTPSMCLYLYPPRFQAAKSDLFSYFFQVVDIMKMYFHFFILRFL